MTDIAIYGAGGLGKEVALIIECINRASSAPKWNMIGFFDDVKPVGTPISHFGIVLGNSDKLNAWQEPLAVVIAIGIPQHLRAVRQRITNDRISFPNIIHPDFVIGDPETFKIGCGNIIKSCCDVTCDVTIGNFNLLNGSVAIGHDTTIGDYNALMTNALISGEVTIGECNRLGVGSIILQRLKIGHDVTLSPGSVLLTKPKDGGLYIGNPAKLFKY